MGEYPETFSCVVCSLLCSEKATWAGNKRFPRLRRLSRKTDAYTRATYPGNSITHPVPQG